MPSGRRQLGRTAHSEGIPWAPWAVVLAAAVSWNSPLLAMAELAEPLMPQGVRDTQVLDGLRHGVLTARKFIFLCEFADSCTNCHLQQTGDTKK